jgi:hypothetical protein
MIDPIFYSKIFTKIIREKAYLAYDPIDALFFPRLMFLL